jgi:hypothetical protein
MGNMDKDFVVADGPDGEALAVALRSNNSLCILAPPGKGRERFMNRFQSVIREHISGATFLTLSEFLERHPESNAARTVASLKTSVAASSGPVDEGMIAGALCTLLPFAPNDQIKTRPINNNPRWRSSG